MREILEITVPDRTNGLLIQNRLSETVKYRLNPALDKLFSEISTPDEIIRINRLEIDLGHVQLSDLDNAFLSGSIEKIKKFLLDQFAERKNISQVEYEKRKGDKSNGEIQFLTTKRNYLESFIYFLEKGRLPWWKGEKSGGPLSDIIGEVLKLEESVISVRLVPLLKIERIRKRLLFQFEEHQIDSLLQKIYGSRYPFFSELIQKIVPFYSVEGVNQKKLKSIIFNQSIEWISANRNIQPDASKTEFFAESFTVYLTGKSKEFQELFLNHGIQNILQMLKSQIHGNIPELLAMALIKVAYHLFSDFEKFSTVIRKTFVPESAQITFYLNTLENKTIEKADDAYSELTDKRKVTASTHEQPESKIVREEIQGKTQKEDKIIPGEFKDELQEITSKEDKQEKDIFQDYRTKPIGEQIYISNAGLVILHPFFRYFFDGLGLLDKKLQFSSQLNAFKAVHLLQYLVSQKQENPEYDLVLNKILCGLDPDETIPYEVELTEEEKSECENLIVAVLNHWSALKTQKTEALRETFLHREGVLFYGTQGWNLKVERNTFDVLLDKLPWGISIIKLPWNPQILFVEW